MIYIFPTDTVFGIGCSINDIESINKIYKIKNRSLDKPLAILCSNIDQVKQLTTNYTNKYNKYWPGALSIVFKKSNLVSDLITSNKDTVAIRIPNNKVALSLIDKYGPLCTTSVNLSGDQPIKDLDTIMNLFSDKVDYIDKSTKICDNPPSTLIDINGNILRAGGVKLDE